MQSDVLPEHKTDHERVVSLPTSIVDIHNRDASIILEAWGLKRLPGYTANATWHDWKLPVGWIWQVWIDEPKLVDETGHERAIYKFKEGYSQLHVNCPYSFNEWLKGSVCYTDVYDSSGNIVAQGETGLTAPGEHESDFIEASGVARSQALNRLTEFDPNWKDSILAPPTQIPL